jgi:hypothetical protein
VREPVNPGAASGIDAQGTAKFMEKKWRELLTLRRLPDSWAGRRTGRCRSKAQRVAHPPRSEDRHSKS